MIFCRRLQRRFFIAYFRVAASYGFVMFGGDGSLC